MIEDYIQHIWTNIKIRRSGIDARASTKLLLFEFLTGALWVGAFLTITTPLWIYPLLRRQHAFTLPYSFVNTFGMNNVLTVICIGAMILKSKFDANV